MSRKRARLFITALILLNLTTFAQAEEAGAPKDCRHDESTLSKTERAKKHYERAVSLSNDAVRFTDRAIECFNSAIALDPEKYATPETYERLGATFYRIKKGSEAIIEYKKAAALLDELMTKGNAISANAYRQIGLISLEHNDYDQAIVWLERTLVIDRQDAATHNVAGRAYQSLFIQQYAQASAEKTTVINTNLILSAQQHLEAAVGEAARAGKLDPANPSQGKYLYDLAACLALTNQVERAAYYFSLAVKTNPNDEEFHHAYARVLSGNSQYHQAITELLEALRINSDDPNTRFDLANIYIKLEQYELAKKQLEEAVNGPSGLLDQQTKAMAHYYLGVAYEETGEFEKATEAYTKAVGLDDSNLEFRMSLPKLRAHVNDRVGALKEFNVFKANLTEKSKDYAFAIIEAAVGDHAGALADLTLVLADKQRSEYGPKLLAAEVYEDIGNYKAAIPYYESLLKLDYVQNEPARVAVLTMRILRAKSETKELISDNSFYSQFAKHFDELLKERSRMQGTAKEVASAIRIFLNLGDLSTAQKYLATAKQHFKSCAELYAVEAEAIFAAKVSGWAKPLEQALTLDPYNRNANQLKMVKTLSESQNYQGALLAFSRSYKYLNPVKFVEAIEKRFNTPAIVKAVATNLEIYLYSATDWEQQISANLLKGALDLQQGKYDAAHQSFRTVLTLEGDTPLIHALMARTYRLLKKPNLQELSLITMRKLDEPMFQVVADYKPKDATKEQGGGTK